ncbi:MAG: Fur family transcriptional regulator [Gaiellales bacterium]
MTAPTSHAHHHGGTSWGTHAADALTRKGTRRSSARDAVVAALGDQECCASAQEIHTRLRAGGSTIGIASVYRTLELLHGMGLVTRVDTGDGVARFEPNHPDGAHHHHHLVCTRCGAVEAFHDEALEEAIHRVAARVDFRVDAHDVALRGACRACR